MKTKIFSVFIIVFFLTVFFVLYKGLQNSNIYTPDTSQKKDIPFFKTKIFYSEKMISSEEIFKNDKFYLLNIWASWCSPCRDEHSFLMELHSHKNLEIIGLNYKDKKKNANKFLKELNNPYEIIILDKDGTLAIEWGAYGVPESFLIQNQKIIKKIIGQLNKDLFAEIKRLIK